MKIEIKKRTNFQCEYVITREDESVELITLKTNTFLIHDVCHFVVEKNLNYKNGFWGMLAQGHTFNELFGKENTRTVELRFIEKIVGPIQSTYLGQMPKRDFASSIEHLNYAFPEELLDKCLYDIESIYNKWLQLIEGQQLTLIW